MKLLLTLFVFALAAHAQIFGPPVRFREVYHSPGAGQSTFPTGIAAGYTVTVIDGNSAAPCTTGGGTTKSVCRYSGSAWQSVGPASAGGGDAQTANPLSQFAATTSAQLRGVLTDETGGTGSAVFNANPTINGLTGIGVMDFSGASAFIVQTGTTAPSSTDCDAAGERGNLHARTGDQATVPTLVSVCTQIGASSYAWMPVSHKVGATDPATCSEGSLFYNTTSDTLRACTATDTWGAIGGGGGDASTNTSSSVDSEVVLFSGTGGKTLKRATSTGVAKVTSGVLGVVSGTATDCVLVDGTSGACGSGGTAATRAQSEEATNNTAMTTPLAATYSVASAGGCGVIMSSATVTVFPGATVAHPCNMQVGNVTRRFTAPATVVLGSGSVSVNASEALVYVKPNGTLYAGLSSAFTVGSMTLSGITAETPIADFPAGSTKLWKWLAGTTDNLWDTTGGDGNGGSNYISLRTKSSILAGAGVTVTESSDGEETIAADTATIPTKDEVVSGSLRYAVTAGSSTVYTLSTPYALASPNANGVCVLGKMDETSGATPTLSVNSATARAIWKHNGTSAAAAVATGDLIANQIYEFCHNTSLNTSGVWEARNTGGGSGGGSVATDAIYDAKGDIPIGTGPNASAVLTVGSNGKIPIAASGETTGVKWAYVTKELYVPTVGCTGVGGYPAAGWGDIKGNPTSNGMNCAAPTNSGMPTQGAWTFANGVTELASFNWVLPSTFRALVSVTYHYATDGTSGNVAFRYGAMCFDAESWLGGTASFTDDAIFTGTASTGSAYFQVSSTNTTTNVDSCTAGTRVAMKIGREGGDALDTNGNTVYLFGITLKWTEAAE